MDKNKSERLANSFARAQQLTKIVSTPEFDQYAKGVTDSMNVDFFDDYSSSINENKNQSYFIDTNKNVDFSKSKLPKAILDEIKKNPLNGLSSDPAMDSFTRELSEKIQKNSYTDFINKKNNQIQEIKSSNQGSTDYEIIKMIVEGTMNKCIESLEKKILSENKGNINEVNTMIVGKKFKFIDGSGNIYEAILKYKGNVNDIKK